MIRWIYIIFVLAVTPCFSDYKIIGYYENWSQYRTSFDEGQFACKPSAFQPVAGQIPYLQGLTVLNYAFAFFNYGSVDSGNNQVTNDWAIHPSEWDDITSWNPSEGLWYQATALKTSFPSLKVMLSIGGWNFCTNGGGTYGSLTYTFFPQMVADSSKTSAFIASAISTCQTNGFDGIDIDWEFPASAADHGGTAADYQNFLDFLAACASALHAEGLLLTATVPPAIPSGTLAGSYMVAGNPFSVDPNTPSTYFTWLKHCSDNIDWLNVMCYDYYGPGYSPEAFNHPGTSFQAPLTADNAPLLPFQSLESIQGTVALYLNAGVVPAKIVIGLPSYGHTYAGVEFPSSWDTQVPNGPGCVYTQADAAGGLTGSPGFLSYIEIYQNLQGPPNRTLTSYATSAVQLPSTNSLPIYSFMLSSEYLAANLNASTYYTSAAYNPDTGTYYAYNLQTQRWVSFDTPNQAPFNTNGQSSIALKCQYIKDQALGGALLWALDDDYYTGLTTPSILQTIVESLGAGATAH